MPIFLLILSIIKKKKQLENARVLYKYTHTHTIFNLFFFYFLKKIQEDCLRQQDLMVILLFQMLYDFFFVWVN